MVKLLLDSGADLHAQDADGQTPLAYARRKSRSSVVELLQNYSLHSPHTYSGADDEGLLLPSNQVHNSQETARIDSNPLRHNFNSTAVLGFPSNLDNQDPIIIIVQDDDEDTPPPLAVFGLKPVI